MDRRHDRRELDADELRRLLAATRDSARTFRGLDRGRTASTCTPRLAGPGSARPALASLTPECFDLDADPPTVTLAARHAKNRRTKVQPLPPDVAELLRDYLRGKPAGRPVWGGTWARDRKGAEMLRHRPGSRRHPLRRRGAGRPAVRRLPRPAAHLPDAGRPGRHRPADAAGTGRALDADPDRPLLAPPAARPGRRRREAAHAAAEAGGGGPAATGTDGRHVPQHVPAGDSERGFPESG